MSSQGINFPTCSHFEKLWVSLRSFRSRIIPGSSTPSHPNSPGPATRCSPLSSLEEPCILGFMGCGFQLHRFGRVMLRLGYVDWVLSPNTKRWASVVKVHDSQASCEKSVPKISSGSDTVDAKRLTSHCPRCVLETFCFEIFTLAS